MSYYIIVINDQIYGEKKILLSGNEVDNFISDHGEDILSINKINIKNKNNFKLEFFEKFTILFQEKFNIDQAIIYLIQVSKNIFLKTFYSNLYDHIKKGNNISLFIERFNDIFDKEIIQIIKSGEITNNINNSFEIIYNYLKFKKDLTKKIINQLIYPVFVITFAILFIFVLFIFIIPNYFEIYSSVLEKIPDSLNLIFKISFVLKNNWFFIFISIIIILLIFYSLTKNGKINYSFINKVDFFKIRSILKKIEFLQIFYIFIKSDFSFDIIIDSFKNIGISENYKKLFILLEKGLKSGKNLSEVFIDNEMFNEDEKSLIKFSESINNIKKGFELLIKENEEILNKKVSLIINIMMPLMYLITGIIIFGIILVIFYPILQLIKSINF